MNEDARAADAPTTTPSSGMPSTADPARLGQGLRAAIKASSPLLDRGDLDGPQSSDIAQDGDPASPVPTLREVMQPGTTQFCDPADSPSDVSSSETPSPISMPQHVQPEHSTATHASTYTLQNRVLPSTAPTDTHRLALAARQLMARPLPTLRTTHDFAAQVAGGQFEPAEREAISNLVVNRGVIGASATAPGRASGGSGTGPRFGKALFDPDAHKSGRDGEERMVWKKGTPVRSRSIRGKDKLGFASLPPHLLRYIFTMALADVAVPPVLDRVWRSQDTWHMVFLLLQRKWLATMRLVCISWLHAANAHPLWLKWLYYFAPARRSHDIHQLYSAADSLSVPFKADDARHRITSRPETLHEIYSLPRPVRPLFAIARGEARGVCVPCRINRPRDPALPPAHRNCATWTPTLGLIGVCWGHSEAWCHHCLRDDQLIAIDEYGRKSRAMGPPDTEDLNLYPSRKGDSDDQGRVRRPGTDVCAACRLDALQYQLDKVMQQCAGGGPVRAKAMVHELPQTTIAGRSYVDWGRGIAGKMAVRAVEENWLTQQARWTEIFDMAMEVQKTEERMREMTRNHGQLGPHGPKMKKTRSDLLREMHGDEDGLEGNWWMGYRWELTENIARWTMEWNGLAEDDEYDIDDEEFEGRELAERWWVRTRQTTMLDWIRDRIKHGFWVSPIDEMAQLNSPPSAEAVHAPIEQIAHTSTHAFPAQAPSDPRVIYAERIGYVRLESFDPEEADDGEKFMPPSQLLLDLDAMFAEKLSARLERPFVEMAEAIMFACAGDVEETRARCREVTGGELLQRLREQPTWFEGGIIWAACQDQAGVVSEAVEEREEESDGDDLLDDEFDHEEEGELFDEPTPGPRIEMVQVGQHMEDNAFGITEVTPSSSLDSDIPDDRERVPDGEGLSERSPFTSQHSETISTDSEGTDVAGDEMDSSATTATMTSLGKRKEAPEGDDIAAQRAGKERKSESPKIARPGPPPASAHDEAVESPSVSPGMPALAVMSESDTRSASETSSMAVPKTPDDLVDPTARDTVAHVDTGKIRKPGDGLEASRSDGLSISDTPLSQRGSSPMSDIRSTPDIDEIWGGEGWDRDAYDQDEDDEDATLPPIEGAEPVMSQNASTRSDNTPHGSIRVKLGEVIKTIPRRGAPKGPQMYLAPQHVPWIPANFGDLGPGAQGVAMKIWEEAWTRVAVCRCGICVRGEAIQIALTD